MPIFACNNLSKAYDRGPLFEGVSFGMEPGDRVGLIGRNGIGKTTLLKLIAGIEEPDKGSVVFNNTARFEYLHQLPVFDSDEIIIDAVMKARPKVYNNLEEHTRLCALLEQKYDDGLSEKVQELNREIEDAGGWALEREAEKILYKLGIRDFNQSVGSLSGGLKKRVALSKALLSAPDLLILDEPTNHLDVDSVQWLQDRLQAAGTSLLIVTHDRYFLDAVSTRIIELDQNKLYSFPGNYQTYLERKELLVEAQNSEANRARVKLRTELAWLQRGARARRTKQRSRIDWISELSKQTTGVEEKKIKIELGSSFMGSRIIDAHNISKSIGGKLLFDDYTYLARPGDRIGIIGPNGSGKSSMLNVLSGKLKTDTGAVKFGPTSKIGYFRQDNDELNPNLSVVGSLKEIAEYIDTGIGRDRYLTTKDLLNKFLFPSRQHSSLVGTLSGGEKRRLMLLRVLMANPNVLLLDEPTNDLDIQTLNSLESYLDDFYGVLIVVSHDRAFLDRCVGIVKAFDGKGNIKEYPGNYSFYLEKKESEAKERSKQKAAIKEVKPKREKKKGPLKKLSYKDQREFDRLEKEIPESEAEKSRIEELMNSGKIIDYAELDKLSKQLTAIEEKIDNDLMIWMELSEKTEG